MPEASQYSMTLNLNVLNHLGINLYSNVPAVISEVVANAWDADAENVDIYINPEAETISITDDGHGMTLADINDKFLHVGYRRRDAAGGAKTLKWERAVMGRKGIGKLSLFSIAKTIEVHSVKDGEKNAFRMVLDDIRDQIKDGNGVYEPEKLDADVVEIQNGTRIILTNLKKKIHQAEMALRKRLARRFSVVGEEFNFAIKINEKPISITDRDYFHKIQFLWRYGDDSDRYSEYCNEDRLEKDELRSNQLPGTPHLITGWIGTVERSGELKDENDNLNKIVIMARGKLAQEDILEDFNEGGMYTKYLIGEIHADFLDSDEEEDIATSSRQRIIEDDPRYVALRSFVYGELKHIQNSWTKLRNEKGVQKAVEIPAIKEWYENLKGDHQKRAASLLGKINQLTIDSEEDRRQLFKHSVLAFEKLRYKESLDSLENISPENLEAFAEVFADLDDIEATLYHQIVKERIQIIETLQKKVEENALEKVIQQHIFDHLWLLEPSWERATGTSYMEKSVQKIFDDVNKQLTEEERNSRLDIKYKTTSGKHVIIELKRAERVVSTAELLGQGSKYRNAMEKMLEQAGKGHEPIEVVYVVGKKLSDWQNEKRREESAALLSTVNMRVVMYQELLENACRTYKAFLDKNQDVGRIYELINSIETGDLFTENVVTDMADAV